MTAMHRHDWTRTETAWACTEDAETCAACVVCEGPTGTSLLICDPCLERERRILDDIVAARDRIALDPPTYVRSYAYDATTTRGADDPAALPFGLDHGVDDWFHHVGGVRSREGVDDILWSWVGAWTEASGDAQNVDHVDYLKGHLLWAANNEASAFGDYRDEMRTLLAVAKSLDPHRPERTGETCLDCGGRLVREWRADGLGDDVVCETCRRRYTEAAYRLAVKARVQSELSDDVLVTMKDAAAALPEAKPGTLRVWAHRAKVDAREGTSTAPVVMRDRDRSGAPLFRLGDIREALGSSERVGA